MTSPRWTDDIEIQQDEPTEKTLRPLKLDDFIGQDQMRQNLKIFIKAALSRQEALDHALIFGQPGLGKTTLSQIIARELGVNMKITSGPIIARSGDLAALLTNLEVRDVLFIDEIHRLAPAVEEILYPAMEDYKLDLMIGEGPSARSVRLDLKPFTLIGATTRSGLLSSPLRDRFGMTLNVVFYTPEELAKILKRASKTLCTPIDPSSLMELASRSRGTPRLALRLLRRVRDFAQVHNRWPIDQSLVQEALTHLDIDSAGLDAWDRRYLTHIAQHFLGGPVGIETLAAALSEERDTLEETIEPYLMQKGFLQRTAKGRLITDRAYQHLNLHPPFKQNKKCDSL